MAAQVEDRDRTDDQTGHQQVLFQLANHVVGHRGEKKISPRGNLQGSGNRELKGKKGSHPLRLFAGNRAWIELPCAKQASSPQLHEACIVAQNREGIISSDTSGQHSSRKGSNIT